jgi:hypothetical protein
MGNDAGMGFPWFASVPGAVDLHAMHTSVHAQSQSIYFWVHWAWAVYRGPRQAEDDRTRH